MWEMTAKQDRGMIFVTHEPTIAARADRVLHLADGRLKPVKAADIEAHMAGTNRK
jgi:predicted ABC-type transport system involved in lysophospholipase L1 biosynthesis ATPase subunit